MNVKEYLANRVRGWLPKTPNLPKRPSASGPSFKRTEVFDHKSLMNRNFPPKSSTDLMNGILIGGSAAVLLTGLLLWSSLNSTYWSQRNVLTMSTYSANDIENILRDSV
jgi:hypothetical protein